MHVFGELLVVEAVGSLDRLLQHLPRGVAEGHEGVAQRVDAALLLGDRLIALQQVARAREVERQHEILVIEDAVHQRPELHLKRRRQQADHGAAEDFGLEPDLVRRVDDADGVGRI